MNIAKLLPMLMVLVFFPVQAQTEKKILGPEDISGKTFWTIGRFGTTVQHYRKDGTFKACGNAEFWCDSGTWTFVDGKIDRVYKSWFQSQNFRPGSSQVIQDGEKITFGSGGWTILPDDAKLPPGVVEDPRKP